MKKSKPAATAAVEDLLRENAAAIRDIRDGIRKLTTDAAIEIGRRLKVVQKKVSHGDWLRWLKKEFDDWSDRSARNFINIYELSQTTKLENFSNLSIPRSAFYLLAAPRTPDKVRDAVLARAQAGEKVSLAKVEEAVAASDPEMDAIVAKRAEHTIDSEPQTVGAAGTHSSRRRVNPRGKYITFLNWLTPDEFRVELLDLCRAVAELDRGWAISLEESPRMISVELPEEVSGDSCRPRCGRLKQRSVSNGKQASDKTDE